MFLSFSDFCFVFRRDIDDIDMPPTVDFDLPPKPLGLHRESTVTFDPDTGMYSKTCLKQSLKNRQNKDLNDKW